MAEHVYLTDLIILGNFSISVKWTMPTPFILGLIPDFRKSGMGLLIKHPGIFIRQDEKIFIIEWRKFTG